MEKQIKETVYNVASYLRCKTCPDKPILEEETLLYHLLGEHEVEEIINIEDIDDASRVRGAMGDLDGLVESIRRFGIIQPVILQRRDGQRPLLVAGGRRVGSLRRLGIKLLRHGHEFVWRDEDLSTPEGLLRIQAMELEENLRREDLHWSEVILGKQRLLATMQRIYGASRGFGAGKSAESEGFGTRKLAQMLGENPSTTSRDLELAAYVDKHPILAKMPTKADAQRKLGVAVTVAAMQNLAKKTISPGEVPHNTVEGVTEGSVSGQIGNLETTPRVTDPALLHPNWRLYHGRFQDSIQEIPDQSVDLVLTDLPYNIGLGDSTAAHSAGLGSFDDSSLDIVSLCSDVSREAYRLLRVDRFAVFFYGMNYHQVLYDALTLAGFIVDVYPFIWLRDRSAPPDGFARYSKTYDPALIASKGTPRFIRPNQANSVSIASVRGSDRLHAAQKPVALMSKFIEDMTVPGCTVVDMFAGAGSTGVAALQSKRKAILFELEKQNCILIESRLSVL